MPLSKPLYREAIFDLDFSFRSVGQSMRLVQTEILYPRAEKREILISLSPWNRKVVWVGFFARRRPLPFLVNQTHSRRPWRLNPFLIWGGIHWSSKANERRLVHLVCACARSEQSCLGLRFKLDWEMRAREMRLSLSMYRYYRIATEDKNEDDWCQMVPNGSAILQEPLRPLWQI